MFNIQVFCLIAFNYHHLSVNEDYQTLFAGTEMAGN